MIPISGKRTFPLSPLLRLYREQEAHWQSVKAVWRLWPEHHSVWNVLGGNWILDVLC